MLQQIHMCVGVLNFKQTQALSCAIFFAISAICTCNLQIFQLACTPCVIADDRSAKSRKWQPGFRNGLTVPELEIQTDPVSLKGDIAYSVKTLKQKGNRSYTRWYCTGPFNKTFWNIIG